MPASLTRVCPQCHEDRATPDDFRDLGVTGAGRPPTVCRVCRKSDTVAAARYARSVAQREAHVELRRRRIARTAGEVAQIQRETHPDGLKVCPPVAGCGRALPLSAYSRNRSMSDGLEGVCLDCRTAHHETRQLREAA